MGVERETVEQPQATGTCTVVSCSRGKSGVWSVEIDLDYLVRLDASREVRVTRRLTVRSSAQIGRRGGKALA